MDRLSLYAHSLPGYNQSFQLHEQGFRMGLLLFPPSTLLTLGYGACSMVVGLSVDRLNIKLTDCCALCNNYCSTRGGI